MALIETVIRKMGEMDYAHNTILNYQRFYKRFLLYAENLGETIIRETHIKNMYWKPHILTG